jgi:hypothetical protein
MKILIILLEALSLIFISCSSSLTPQESFDGTWYLYEQTPYGIQWTGTVNIYTSNNTLTVFGVTYTGTFETCEKYCFNGKGSDGQIHLKIFTDNSLSIVNMNTGERYSAKRQQK